MPVGRLYPHQLKVDPDFVTERNAVAALLRAKLRQSRLPENLNEEYMEQKDGSVLVTVFSPQYRDSFAGMCILYPGKWKKKF